MYRPSLLRCVCYHWALSCWESLSFVHESHQDEAIQVCHYHHQQQQQQICPTHDVFSYHPQKRSSCHVLLEAIETPAHNNNNRIYIKGTRGVVMIGRSVARFAVPNKRAAGASGSSSCCCCCRCGCCCSGLAPGFLWRFVVRSLAFNHHVRLYCRYHIHQRTRNNKISLICYVRRIMIACLDDGGGRHHQ
jgi:hypothetical protein